MSELPELPFEQWEPTKDTLHLWAQIVGKVRLAATPPQNHWWNAPLYVDTRGLTTRRMPLRDGDFDVTFDFVEHELVVRTSRGRGRVVPARGRAFGGGVLRALLRAARPPRHRAWRSRPSRSVFR